MVATPGPQEHHGMVTEIFYVAVHGSVKTCPTTCVSYHVWIMLFAKELIRDSENQSMEMKSRRGTIF